MCICNSCVHCALCIGDAAVSCVATTSITTTTTTTATAVDTHPNVQHIRAHCRSNILAHILWSIATDKVKSPAMEAHIVMQVAQPLGQGSTQLRVKVVEVWGRPIILPCEQHTRTMGMGSHNSVCNSVQN